MGFEIFSLRQDSRAVLATDMLNVAASMRFYERELTNVSKSAAQPLVHSMSTFDRVRKRWGITYVQHYSRVTVQTIIHKPFRIG